MAESTARHIWQRGIGNDCHDVYGNDGAKVAHVYNPGHGTIIVHSVNSHDVMTAQVAELRAALEKLTKIWSDYSSQEMYGEHLSAGIEETDFDAWMDAHQQARAALAKGGSDG